MDNLKEYSNKSLDSLVNTDCVRIYENNIQARLTNKKMWFSLSISPTQLFKYAEIEEAACFKTKEVNLFFYKVKNGKIKIHMFGPTKIMEGGVSTIYGGYKLSGKNLPFLKPTILKAPKISERRLGIMQEKFKIKYQENNIKKTELEIKKEAKRLLYAYLSDSFIKEKEGLDLIYNPNQKILRGVQKKIDCFYLKQKVYIVSTRYSHNLLNIDLSLNQKLQGAKQIAWGMKEIFKKKCRTIDVKTENIVLDVNEDEDDGKVDMVHIDLELYNLENIKKSIEEASTFFLNRYTPDYLHENDTIEIREAANGYRKNKEERFLKEYMKVSKRIMLYQLGNIYLFLFTGSYLAQYDKDVDLNSVNMYSLVITGAEIKKCITNAFEEEIKQDPKSATALERIYPLLIKMLDENPLNRPKINDVIQELHAIDVLQQRPEKNKYTHLKICHSI